MLLKLLFLEPTYTTSQFLTKFNPDQYLLDFSSASYVSMAVLRGRVYTSCNIPYYLLQSRSVRLTTCIWLLRINHTLAGPVYRASITRSRVQATMSLHFLNAQWGALKDRTTIRRRFHFRILHCMENRRSHLDYPRRQHIML